MAKLENLGCIGDIAHHRDYKDIVLIKERVVLQHSRQALTRQTLTKQQQRQLWQQRKKAHRVRRAKRQQEHFYQHTSQSTPSDQRRQAVTNAKRDRRSSPSPLPPRHLQKPSLPQRSSIHPHPRKQSQPLGLLSYLVRLMIVGSGVAAIAGTLLSVLDPIPRAPSQSQSPTSSQSVAAPPSTSPSPKTFESSIDSPQSLLFRWSQEPRFTRLIREGQELKALKRQVRQWAAAEPELKPALFFLNPHTGDYLDIQGQTAISAASTIKIPVLLALFEEVDAGNITLNERLVMRKDLVASEAGAMQYQPVGTQFSVLETAEQMIAISDNTATNMLIDRLGGVQKLNQRFKAWGLKHTVLRDLLPDLQGNNTVSPYDMAALMLKLKDEDLLSPKSRGQVLNILRQTVTKTLLPEGLGSGAKIAHKTGDIGSVVGDVGLVEMPNGQHYVAAILVRRPHNDPRAQELIRKISKLTYKTFQKKR